VLFDASDIRILALIVVGLLLIQGITRLYTRLTGSPSPEAPIEESPEPEFDWYFPDDDTLILSCGDEIQVFTRRRNLEVQKVGDIRLVRQRQGSDSVVYQ
jgi:hypothetical protein